MRLLIAAPPKTGNVWLEKLCSVAFGLRWLTEVPALDYWNGTNPDGLDGFLESGRFPETTVCHQHYWPSAALFALANTWDIRIATTLRDPYDQFVSWYWYVQRFQEPFIAARDPSAAMIGKSIDDETVVDFLVSRFGRVLDQGVAWLESGQSLVVRYEDLHERPAEILDRAESQFEWTPMKAADEAILGASAEKLRQESPSLRLHVRAARVGDWKNHLTDAHLRAFRQHHRSRIDRLGYEVR
jgi:Sulfotransferase domain